MRRGGERIFSTFYGENRLRLGEGKRSRPHQYFLDVINSALFGKLSCPICHIDTPPVRRRNDEHIGACCETATAIDIRNLDVSKLQLINLEESHISVDQQKYFLRGISFDISERETIPLSR